MERGDEEETVLKNYDSLTKPLTSNLLCISILQPIK